MMQEMDMTPQHGVQSPRPESIPDWASPSGFQSFHDVVPQKIRHRQGSRERRPSRNSRHLNGHARSPGSAPRQTNESRRRSSREFLPNWQN